MILVSSGQFEKVVELRPMTFYYVSSTPKLLKELGMS